MLSHIRHTSSPPRRRRVTGTVTAAACLALVLGGCAGRGSAEDGPATDAATAFLAAASSSPQDACELLAPATLESLQSDGEDCAEAVTEAAPEGSPPGEPSADVYGRDAMVRWGGTTLFLARFDDGWLVTAAGCEPREEDLPYDCSIEGR